LGQHGLLYILSNAGDSKITLEVWDNGSNFDGLNKTGETVVQLYANDYVGACDRKGKGRMAEPVP
tara:strand:- start:523 stop:717 length:195 start_codon:yes stop_codon:yes gene_type:complete